MSPDEDIPIKDYGSGPTGAYLCRCVHCGTDFIGHKRDVWCGCTRHRASGEGGSTSALRASAPEGQHGDACQVQRDPYGRCTCGHEDRRRLRHALYVIANVDGVKHRDAKRIAQAALARAASVEAGPSRGAPAPLAPEEQRNADDMGLPPEGEAGVRALATKCLDASRSKRP